MKTFLKKCNLSAINTFYNNHPRFIQASCLTIIIICTLFIAHVFDKEFILRNTPSIVTIDTKKIVSDFTNVISENRHIPDSLKVILFEQFKKTYPMILKGFSRSSKIIIIDKSLLLESGKTTDISQSVEKILERNTLDFLKKKKMERIYEKS